MSLFIDNSDNLKCPACGEEMVKVYISDSNINIDFCLNGCGGMFFDNRELEKVDESHENAKEILDLVKEKTFTPVVEEKRLILKRQ